MKPGGAATAYADVVKAGTKKRKVEVTADETAKLLANKDEEIAELQKQVCKLTTQVEKLFSLLEKRLSAMAETLDMEVEMEQIFLSDEETSEAGIIRRSTRGTKKGAVTASLGAQ